MVPSLKSGSTRKNPKPWCGQEVCEFQKGLPSFGFQFQMQFLLSFICSLNIKHTVKYITKSKQNSSFCANTVMTIFSMKPANSGIHA